MNTALLATFALCLSTLQAQDTDFSNPVATTLTTMPRITSAMSACHP